MKFYGAFLFSLCVLLNTSILNAQCPTGSITFATQQDIDDFAANYPGCTELLEYVCIGDCTYPYTASNIINLNGLSQLNSFGGFLSIRTNTGLTSLNGLDYVTSIGDLDIANNANLTSLNSLSNLTSIGVLGVNNNAALTNLSGLNNITSIGSVLIISNNASLTTLSALNNVTSIGANLSINYNATLVSLNGLNNVTSIGGYLYVANNDALTSLSGIENIDHTTIIDLTLQSSPGLSFCEVQSICDYLDIPSNPATISGNATGCNTRTEIEAICEALPVELTTFNANLKEKYICLTWQTQSETNNAGFQIQKSNDGDRWNDLVFIEGQGTSNLINEYNYMDTQPFYGENYYRLKQMDFDGGFEYSNIILVNFESIKNNNRILLYPNPANDIINIDFSFYDDHDTFKLIIRNSIGEIFYKESGSHVSIDITKLISGLYFLQIESDNKVFVSQFVKQ